MSDKKLMETVYGKYHKYEIVKHSSLFSVRIYIRKDGKATGESYGSLRDAVAAAQKKG